MNNFNIKPIVITRPPPMGNPPVPINPIPPKYPNDQPTNGIYSIPINPIVPNPGFPTPITPILPNPQAMPNPLFGPTGVAQIPPKVLNPGFLAPVGMPKSPNTNLNAEKPNPFAHINPKTPTGPIPVHHVGISPIFPKTPTGPIPVHHVGISPIFPNQDGFKGGVITKITKEPVKEITPPFSPTETKVKGPQSPAKGVSPKVEKSDVDEPKPKPKQIKESVKVSFREFEEKFESTAIEVIKERKLMKNFDKAKILFNMKKDQFTTKFVQEVLYGKSNITFVFKTITKNVYCVTFKKFDQKPDDDAWMKDLSYCIYVLYKDGKECDSEWKRQGVKDGDEKEKENQKNSYGLFKPSNTKEVIQTYCGFTIMKDKTLMWDEEFSNYYIDTKGSKTIEDKQEEEVNELIIMEWTG